jgi:hypothetical protein
MTDTLIRSSTGLRTLAILSGLMLGSCQTNAGDILAPGALTEVAEAAPSTQGGYVDPRATTGAQPVAARTEGLPLTEGPAHLKRKPVPLAAAYTDIAEPPPEVLALQQQALSGQKAASQDLGALEPTTVNSGKNSLFSPGRSQSPNDVSMSNEAQPRQPQPQSVARAEEPVTSLVPGNMPTLSVNAMSKSLFSPSAEQQQALVPPEPASTAATVPLVEQDNGPPVLHKLSDPRPKRKMLALREPTGQLPPVDAGAAAVPDRVQLTSEQLAAMGAVPESPADGAAVADATPEATDPSAGKKKKWLPSLSQLLRGGEKAKKPQP